MAEEPSIKHSNDMARELYARVDKVVRRTGSKVSSSCMSITSFLIVPQLSESHIRRAIRRGDLPASNVGTPDHPIWRISRKDLVEWMDRKKGGTSKVPPRSSLKDLVERHLPGL